MSKEAMKLAEALEYLTEQAKTDYEYEIVKVLKEALAKQEQGEPVARIEITYHRGQLESWRFSERPTNAPEGTYDVYTTPQQRKPLTDEQIDELAEWHALDHMVYEPFARAIEAAHGIKE